MVRKPAGSALMVSRSSGISERMWCPAEVERPSLHLCLLRVGDATLRQFLSQSVGQLAVAALLLPVLLIVLFLECVAKVIQPAEEGWHSRPDGYLPRGVMKLSGSPKRIIACSFFSIYDALWLL